MARRVRGMGVPLFKGVKPTKAVLRDHFDPLYPDFNTDYPDQLRADEFLNEFGAYARARAADESADFQLPAFVCFICRTITLEYASRQAAAGGFGGRQ